MSSATSTPRAPARPASRTPLWPIALAAGCVACLGDAFVALP